MAFKYLPDEILAGFDKYKYNSIDSSPISKYITHPFWNWIVEYCPRWIAPNVLTFSGFVLLVIQFSFLTYYDCGFYASDDSHTEYPPIPSMMWLVAAGCMFWAHTLDGIDGKQARRTGTSSPLGELFDHGLDSWATMLMPIGLYSVFGRGELSIPADRCFYVFLGIMATFLVSHWEKYNTGVLYLPWGYDISQMGMAVVYIVTFLAGYKFWKFTLPVVGSSGEIFELIMHVSVWMISIPISIWNVYLSYRDGNGKNRSLYENIRPLLPVALQFALFTVWMKYSSYDVVRRSPRLFYVALGTVFSNITCRLIVNGMSNTRSQMFNWLLVPLMAIVIGVLTLQLGIIELYLLWAYTIFVLASHIHYGIRVVQELADHLNIYVFSVKRPGEKSE